MPARPWRPTIMATMLTVGLSACVQDATMVRESPSGGVAAFPFIEEHELLSSRGRTEALGLIERKCGSHYRIVHEGTIPRISPEIDRQWRGQINTVYDGGKEERLWGIQFTCH